MPWKRKKKWWSETRGLVAWFLFFFFRPLWWLPSPWKFPYSRNKLQNLHDCQYTVLDPSMSNWLPQWLRISWNWEKRWFFKAFLMCNCLETRNGAINPCFSDAIGAKGHYGLSWFDFKLNQNLWIGFPFSFSSHQDWVSSRILIQRKFDMEAQSLSLLISCVLRSNARGLLRQWYTQEGHNFKTEECSPLYPCLAWFQPNWLLPRRCVKSSIQK